MSKNDSGKVFIPGIIFRIVICAVVLGMGMVVMRGLINQKTPPVVAEIRERAIHVDVRAVVLEDVAVVIDGMGKVRSRNVVSIAPEVAGRIVYVHASLEKGEVIPKGEVLFRIDPRDYEARNLESEASVDLWKNTIKRLTTQRSIDRDRLKTLERSEDLARQEYERIQQLFQTDSVGTQSGVDQAERVWNGALDQAHQLSQTVSLYPMRIQEARASLSSMEAMAGLADVNLERTEVKAPFNARIRSVHLEEGQYVVPGKDVLTLADDSILEVTVGLDSEQANDWLRFGEVSASAPAATEAWFNDLEPVPVEIEWVEGDDRAVWYGVLDRVEEFDPTTHTLRVVIRVEGKDALSEGGRLPLVEGMFCKVRIPGKIAKGVIRLPAQAVGMGAVEHTVYVASVGEEAGVYRLKTTVVRESHKVKHDEFDDVFVMEGLEEGDLVVTTRLVNPLENSLLEVEIENETGTGS